MRGSKEEMVNHLVPNHQGVGVPGGAEAIIFSLQELIARYGHDKAYAMLQVDGRNAFNETDRNKMLQEIKRVTPKTYRWSCYIYSSNPIMFASTKLIYSKTGSQQGDPRAPGNFALTIHPMYSNFLEKYPSIKANLWFLDDGNIIAKVEDLKLIVEELIREGPRYGFYLNMTKKEIWWPTPDVEKWRESFPREFVFDTNPGTKVLGNSVGGKETALIIATKRVEKIRKILEPVTKMNHTQSEHLDPFMCGLP
jgi:hypothetical protein